MIGVACLSAYGLVALFLIFYFEVRCCKGRGFSVTVREYVPRVGIINFCAGYLIGMMLK